MIVNSVGSQRVNNIKYCTPNNSAKNSQPTYTNNYTDSRSFGSASLFARKARGITAAVAMLPYIIGGGALVASLVSCDPIEILIPPEATQKTPARQAMDYMLDIADALGVTPSAKILSKSTNFTPIKGDIQEFGFTDDRNRGMYNFSIDTTKSTSDSLAYNVLIKDADGINDDENTTATVTKSADGIILKMEGADFSQEFIKQDGYILVKFIDKDGVKTPTARLYPKDSGIKVTDDSDITAGGVLNGMFVNDLSNPFVGVVQ